MTLELRQRLINAQLALKKAVSKNNHDETEFYLSEIELITAEIESTERNQDET